MSFVVAVVGATGAVGREMVRILHERRFPLTRLVALASRRSAGQKLGFGPGDVTVAELTPHSFAGVDVALFSAGSSVSREFGPVAAASGAVVIDNSSAWRMDDDVPLVVPEVNMAAAARRPRGIIANPNCATIQMVVALKPLHDAAGIKHVVVSTYQATSGKGHAAVDEFLAQARAILEGRTPDSHVFPGIIAFNVLCDWKPGEDDYSEEETKIVHETRKILDAPLMGISPTTVRVPVLNGPLRSAARAVSPTHARRRGATSAPRCSRGRAHRRALRPREAPAAAAGLRDGPGVRRSRARRPGRPGCHQPICRERQPAQGRGAQCGADRRALARALT
jgi:aspartate-semialdehyde dehydrogenase